MPPRKDDPVWAQKDPLLSPLALGMLLGVVALMVHMFVEIHHTRSVMPLLFLTPALLAVLPTLRDETNGNRQAREEL